MDEVRRDEDGELCGYVAQRDDGWHALAVFGGTLAVCPDRDEAVGRVRSDGLASLAQRWLLHDADTDDEQIVCIQEASPERVTLALDYYSMPGVPTLELSRDELDGGRWTLRRN